MGFEIKFVSNGLVGLISVLLVWELGIQTTGEWEDGYTKRINEADSGFRDISKLRSLLTIASHCSNKVVNQAIWSCKIVDINLFITCLLSGFISGKLRDCRKEDNLKLES